VLLNVERQAEPVPISSVPLRTPVSRLRPRDPEENQKVINETVTVMDAHRHGANGVAYSAGVLSKPDSHQAAGVRRNARFDQVVVRDENRRQIG
jgi:hypothetical protein